jgi:hypothetical protein
MIRVQLDTAAFQVQQIACLITKKHIFGGYYAWIEK